MRFKVKVEIGFASGLRTPLADVTWTDVSDRVYGPAVIKWGRDGNLGQCTPTTCSIAQVDNRNGDFTAEYAGGAYYPNIRLFRPIRVTLVTVDDLDVEEPYERFTGYVDSWPTEWSQGTDLGVVYANLTAISRTGALALFNALRSIVVESAVENGATDVFLLDEPADSQTAESELTGATLTLAGGGKRLRFTDDHVTFAGGQYLKNTAAPFVMNADLSVALSVRFTTQPAANSQLYGPLRVTYFSDSIWRGLTDGVWHRVVMGYDDSAGEAHLYVDGSLAETISWPNAPQFSTYIGKWFFGSLKDVCRFGTLLSPADVTQDYQAFLGGRGTASDDLLELLAGFASIPADEVDADPGAVNMGAVDTRGMTVLDAFRVVESTEGGAILDDRDGDLRMFGRRVRYGSAPVVTLDFEDEEVGTGYGPVLDRSNLRNDVTGTNAASNVLGVDIGATSYRAFDQDSIDEYGVAGSSVEVNAERAEQGFAAASWIVENNKQPRPRIPAVVVDLLPLDDAKVPAVLGVFFGDRVALANRPVQDSTSDTEVFVEGGSETYAADVAELSWNVSAVGLEDSIIRINVDQINDPDKVIGY